MGALQSAFSVPMTNSIEDLYSQLEIIVASYEKFNKSVQAKPNAVQTMQNMSYKSQFKEIYKQIIRQNSTSKRADELLTRYKKVELRLDVLLYPETYNYLKEPLLPSK